MSPTLLALVRTIAVALVFAVLIAACGAGPAVVNSSTLALRIDEYHISPEAVRVLAGRLHITLTNDGVLTHVLAVTSLGGGVHYASVGTVFPHHTRSSRVFVLGPGRYRMQDTTANYADLGAYGTITVTAR